MSHIMSASGFPCIEGDFSSPVHFWEQVRKQAESDRRIPGFLSCCLLASSSARHAAPSSALLQELPFSPLPSWQQPPLFSLSLKKPAPMTPFNGIFLGPPERARAETGGADQWVLSEGNVKGLPG